MAYQHFFSRVPARVSMFNKADGYDTFVASSLFTREYIEQNMSGICDYRPSKYEAGLIRQDKLRPAYCQFEGKKGQLFQSCLSYIPLDFTGERSSFLLHSIVLSDEEKAVIDEQYDRQVINPQLFVTDISSFKITRAAGSPVFDYPEIPFVADKMSGLDAWAAGYDQSNLRAFIYALLQTVCGKGKSVFVTLNKPLATFSEDALTVMNNVLQVFPHHVRNKISFITYISDYTKLNMFNVKFLPPDCMTIPFGKGFTFNMTPQYNGQMLSGIKDDEINAQALVVDFLQGLFADRPLRSRFIKFATRAVKAEPSLAQPTFKNLAAMVTVFRQICKTFTEKQVLPDDNKVLEMFTVYEKYKNILTPTDRCLVYSCLSRYVRLHQPIPQNIFAKVTKLYPKEQPRVKACVMNIVLELIHTDLMRDKLFAFIKANFADETPKSRSLICRNLVRVYYGGFLQSQILSLYTDCFAEETEGTQDYIFEKLMLSIRTPSVQQQLVAFLEKYYQIFTEHQKKVMYKTFFEMLPEADDLSVVIIKFLNEHISKEDPAIAADVSERLVKTVDVECRRASNLIVIIGKNGGYCEQTVLKVLLTQWTQRKVFRQYIDLLAQDNFDIACGKLLNCFGVEATPDVANAFVEQLSESLRQNATKCDFTKLAARYQAFDEFAQSNPQNVWTNFCRFVLDECIAVALQAKVCECLRFGSEKIAFTLDFAEKYPFVKQSDGYALVVATQKLANGEQKPFDSLALFEKFAAYKPELNGVAQLLEATLLVGTKEKIAADENSDDIVDACMLCGYLRNGEFDLDKAYQTGFAGFERKRTIAAGDNPKLIAKVSSAATIDALVAVVKSCARMRLSDASDWLKNSVCGNEQQQGLLAKQVSKRLVALGVSDQNVFASRLAEVDDQPLVNEIKPKSSGGLAGFFSKLFGKK